MEYVTTLLIALVLNRADKRMLVLTCLVGVSYFLPVDRILDRNVWFLSCIVSEVIIALWAMSLNTKASVPVAGVCFLLIVKHILGWNHVALSDYSLLVQYFEYLEIICCLLFSDSVLNYIGEGLKCQTRRC